MAAGTLLVLASCCFRLRTLDTFLFFMPGFLRDGHDNLNQRTHHPLTHQPPCSSSLLMTPPYLGTASLHGAVHWVQCPQSNREPKVTYKTKHAEAARLDYTTTQRHIDTNMNRYRPASTPKLGHARESHCAPSHLGQHGVASHEAQQHGGAQPKGAPRIASSQQAEEKPRNEA